MRSVVIMQRIIKEMLRDKRTLALLFLAPILVLTLVHFMFSETSDPKAKLGVYNVDSEIIAKLDKKHVTIQTFKDKQGIKTKVADNQLDGFLAYNQAKERYTITYLNSDLSKTTLIAQNLQGAITKLKLEQLGTAVGEQQKAVTELSKVLESVLPLLPAQTQAQLQEQSKLSSQNSAATKKNKKNSAVTSRYLYGSQDSTFFDTLVPLLMAMFVFLFVFLISGIALLKERTSGTLERLLATPVRRSQIVLGYIGGYGLFALIQTSLILAFVLFVLKIEIVGNILLVLLVAVLLALIALIIGIFVSTFANSEFQMVQFIPLVIVPQIFFSGLIPLDGMNGFLQGLAHIMPLYYGATALTDIITKGYGFAQVGWKIGILVLFSIVFIFLNIRGLKRYRQV